MERTTAFQPGAFPSPPACHGRIRLRASSTTGIAAQPSTATPPTSAFTNTPPITNRCSSRGRTNGDRPRSGPHPNCSPAGLRTYRRSRRRSRFGQAGLHRVDRPGAACSSSRPGLGIVTNPAGSSTLAPMTPQFEALPAGPSAECGCQQAASARAQQSREAANALLVRDDLRRVDPRLADTLSSPDRRRGQRARAACERESDRNSSVATVARARHVAPGRGVRTMSAVRPAALRAAASASASNGVGNARATACAISAASVRAPGSRAISRPAT